MRLCRYRARLMYDGTNYCGFQAQANAKSVQNVVNSVLSKRFSIPISTTGASRTDTGVHARGNCIHFDAASFTADMLGEHEFRVNQLLPEDIRISNLSILPTPESEDIEPFHAISFAQGKLYSYSFCTNSAIDPLRSRYCAHFSKKVDKLDMGMFEESLQQFVGTHDFVSFANKVEKTRAQYEVIGASLDTVRTVDSITVAEEGNGYFRVNVRVQSALNRMLRNMVGTSLCVAEGRMSIAQQQALLKEAPGRVGNPALPAPAHGLVLEHVYYDDY